MSNFPSRSANFPRYLMRMVEVNASVSFQVRRAPAGRVSGRAGV